MNLPRYKPNRRLILTALAGFGAGLAMLGYLILPAPAQPVLLSADLEELRRQGAAQGEPRAGLPIGLKIPAIQVDSRLEQTGLTSSGDVDTPKSPGTAAWFKHWPRPGDTGSAVIVGHFGWKDNLAAVFDNLHKLKPGDKVYIQDEAGKTVVFAVRELRIYGREDKPADVFRSSDGRAHLNLITCQGTWNRGQASYSNRLVVFTDMVED